MTFHNELQIVTGAHTLLYRPYLAPYSIQVQHALGLGRLKASHKTVGRAGTESAGRMGRKGEHGARAGVLTGADTVPWQWKRLLHTRPLMSAGCCMGRRTLASVRRKHDYFLRRHYHYHSQSRI